MGNIEHIEKLETYIEDLGNEITKVKKASEYLALIEKFQAEISETSATLSQTKNQLKLSQDIIENKLELYLTTTKNIEGKQKSIEQTQAKLITSLSELKEQMDENKKSNMAAFVEVKQITNCNRDDFMAELNKVQNQQEVNQDRLMEHIKNSKNYFMINIVLIASALFLLIYLLIK